MDSEGWRHITCVSPVSAYGCIHQFRTCDSGMDICNGMDNCGSNPSNPLKGLRGLRKYYLFKSLFKTYYL